MSLEIHLMDYEDGLVGVDFNTAESNLGEEDLRNILRKLPDVTQHVFNLFAIDGYKHREIADYLGISEGTSKWHVSDARKKLKTMLEEQQIKEQKSLEIRG
jgi:RNA polymerase sigma factor (sigma-70 family)